MLWHCTLNFLQGSSWGAASQEDQLNKGCALNENLNRVKKDTDHHHMLHRVGADLLGPCWTKLSCEIWSVRVLVRGIFAAAQTTPKCSSQQKNAPAARSGVATGGGQTRPSPRKKQPTPEGPIPKQSQTGGRPKRLPAGDDH